MAHEISVPRLGWSMESGTFLRWLKQEGDFVTAGEPLFELEGDKAAQDVEAVDSGILRISPSAPAPGSVVAVGALLGYLVAEGEAAPEGAQAEPPVVPSQQQSSPTTAVFSRDSMQRTRHNASPRARRLANELKIDLVYLNGTGSSGRIREQDVKASAAGRREPVRGSSSVAAARRQSVAARLRKSQAATVSVTLTSQADATQLVALRDGWKSAGRLPVPSYTDMIAKLVAGQLKQFSYMAARWQGDQLATGFDIDIGIAVDTDEGLLVPIIRSIDQLTLQAVATRSSELIDAARSGKLSAADMQGGAFTITNLGAYGIDAFTPVINYPEIAILGVGTIRRIAAVERDRCVPRDIITLSLTFDHAAIDGAPAARFLQAVCRGIERAGDELGAAE